MRLPWHYHLYRLDGKGIILVSDQYLSDDMLQHYYDKVFSAADCLLSDLLGSKQESHNIRASV